MARLRASWRTSLPVVQQPRNPQSESIARSPYEYARSHVVYVCVSPTTQNSRLAGDRAQNEDFVLVSQGAGHQRTQVPLPPVPCNRVGKGHRPVIVCRFPNSTLELLLHADNPPNAPTSTSERVSLVGRDLVFDLAERGSGEHPLRQEFVSGRIGTACDDCPPKPPAKAVQLLNRGGVDVDKLRVNCFRSVAVHTLGILRIPRHQLCDDGLCGWRYRRMLVTVGV